jgi:hypothetical protein
LDGRQSRCTLHESPTGVKAWSLTHRRPALKVLLRPIRNVVAVQLTT